MNFKTYSSEGVVLGRINYGESDRILTVYSRHFGKIRLLAKGVRKPKSRKRGHIEIFSLIKFSVVKGKGFDILTEAQLINSFKVLRTDLKKVSVAYFLCEMISKVTREEEKNEILFMKMVENLELLQENERLKSLREGFIKDTLTHLGFWPLGKPVKDADKLLEEVVEYKMNSVRVGRKVLN